MRKFVMICMTGAALTLSGCAGNNDDVDYGYESQAPYSDDRTVGEEDQAAATTSKSRKAEHMFQSRQRK